MKKLIKLLFPKTYQAIYDEAYGYGRYDEYTQWMFANDNYEHDDDYQQYMEMTQEELDYHESEMAEHYQRLRDGYEGQLIEEYQAELAEEYEQECRKAEQLLAEIYNPKPPALPVLNVGDKIHLHSKQGMYTVTKAFEYSFAYRTRDSIDDAYADYNDYKCHAGGKWN